MRGAGGQIAAALVLLAGIVALGVDRIPEVLGWCITVAGAALLLAEALRRR